MKTTPSEKQILKAYQFVQRWAKTKGLDEDDIQDIVIKYTRFFNPNMNCEAQLYLLIQQHIYKKYFKVNQKHSGTTMSYDALDSVDSFQKLSVDPYHQLEEKEHQIALKWKIDLLMKNLTPKQKYVINEVYINERTQTDVGNELKITRQAVSSLLQAVLNKMKNNE